MKEGGGSERRKYLQAVRQRIRPESSTIGGDNSEAGTLANAQVCPLCPDCLSRFYLMKRHVQQALAKLTSR